MPKSEILSAKGANNPRGSYTLHIKSWIMCHGHMNQGGYIG